MLFSRPNRSRTPRRPDKPFTLPAGWKCAPLRLEALDERAVPAFLDAVNYAAGNGPDAVAAGDFNRDAVPDLAVVGGSAVSVLLGNTDGTFRPAISSPAGNTPDALAVGDFNADGKLDVATADQDGNAGYNTSLVTVLLGQGNGSFNAPTSYDFGNYDYYGAESVAVGDFNADGKLDLVAVTNTYFFGYGGYAGDYHGFGHVLLGTGTGTFARPIRSWLGGGYHDSAAVGDFNGDHKPDFASTSIESGKLHVVLGTGTGSFGNPASYLISNYDGLYDRAPYSVAAADLNKDGRVDLVATDPFTDSVKVFLGNGLGSFGSPQSYAAGPWTGPVTTADFNGDGATDLITTNSGRYGTTVSALIGTGTGAFNLPITAAVGASPSGVAVGDFNRDGRMDAAASNNSSSNVSVLINGGSWPAANAPSISIGDATVTEGNTGTVGATFTVSLSAAAAVPVTVHYATADGSATTADGDFQATSGTLTFAPGQTTKAVTVPVNGDRVRENDEAYLLVLTDPINVFLADAQGSGTIVDDEPRVGIDYDYTPVFVTEGNTGTTTAAFTVRLSNAYDQPVDVNFSTAEGDTEWWEGGGYGGGGGYYGGYYGGGGGSSPPPPAATSGTDFQAQTGTLTFAPGETVKTVVVVVNGDRLVEDDEYFSVDLTGASPNATLDESTDHAVGVIVDDEPRVSVGSASVTEGNAGTRAMTFAVTLSAASDGPITVNYATQDGYFYGFYAATAGEDYQATSGTLTFAPGETTKTFTVPVYGDRLGEYDESFYVNLGSADAHVDYGSTTGTILDDEPRISVNSASITEGNSGTKLMTFTVTLSAAYDQTVTVNYHTEDITAKAGEDYVATSGTLTFTPGQTSKTFTVVIKGDTTKEADESFYVWLTDPSSNAHLWQNYGWGDILNDDGKRK